jgi:hypothetical protein
MSHVDILKFEIHSFYTHFIELVEAWAINDFNNMRNWLEDYGAGKFGFDFASIKYSTLPKYVLNPDGSAFEHIARHTTNEYFFIMYNIEKISHSISEYGFNMDDLIINSSFNENKITIKITDGVKKMTWSAEIVNNKIQKPYYLFKKH